MPRLMRLSAHRVGGRDRDFESCLDTEAKLDLILKEIQDLKLRVDGLESKSNEKTLKNRESHRENHNDSRREESASRSKIMKMT